MGIPKLFKLSKPKQFSYSPRYYDPVKEEFEERVKKARGEQAESAGEVHIPRIKGQIKSQFNRNKTNAKAKNTSNIRLVIIIAILLFAAWYFLFK